MKVNCFNDFMVIKQMVILGYPLNSISYLGINVFVNCAEVVLDFYLSAGPF